MFERDGFVDAKITSITQAAGVAAGSFYTHFDSKDAIFQALIDGIHEETLHPGIEDAHTPQESIAATNRAYLEHYDRNARLFVLMDQVALIDDSFREVRQGLSQSVAKRNARAIKRWQERRPRRQGPRPADHRPSAQLDDEPDGLHALRRRPEGEQRGARREPDTTLDQRTSTEELTKWPGSSPPTPSSRSTWTG